ncbi:MAG: hypothetical protein PHE17_20075 [Thiothrix sp.]|uniref:hypothetical protein n=1 Tax=Thiothrix sp. TaxID=1032 RepID=UPI00260492F3|nr:hypothetical protein [Thiothrix sp.]MDD5395328.1 hypothetical protein [Thiothrix sp.]
MAIEQAIQESALYQQVMAQPPHWANEKILSWKHEEFLAMRPFLTHHYWADSGTLNVFNVVGTRHPAYQGLDWIEFLQQGKRMHQNLPLYDSNPSYYTDSGKKSPEMSFLSVNGIEWYVDDDGNHRTCIAKFARFYDEQMELHGLKLHDYRFDDALYSDYLKCLDIIKERRLGADVSIQAKESPSTERRDTAGWYVELHQPTIVLDRRTQNPRTLKIGELGKVMDDLTMPAYRRWFKAWGF